MKDVVENVVCSIDDDFFVQCSCQSSSFFYQVRSIKEFTMFYAFKANISNGTKTIFKNVDLVEFDVILCVIHNFYDAILYELTPVIVIWLKMNAFMNKLDKRTSVKNISQIDIFTKASFSVWIINVYQFYVKRVNSKTDWTHVYKIKFMNERKMQNFEQKIIEIYFDCVIIDKVYIIRTSDSDFWNVFNWIKKQISVSYTMLFNVWNDDFYKFHWYSDDDAFYKQ